MKQTYSLDNPTPQNNNPMTSKKASSYLRDETFALLTNDNLPRHHYDTVKVWLRRLLDEFRMFSDSFQRRVERNNQSKMFYSNDFVLDDINLVFLNCYRIIDSSVANLTEFRSSMEDYVSTWKAIVSIGFSLEEQSSDSSVEVKTSLEPKICPSKVIGMKEDKPSCYMLDSTRIKEQNPRIRVRDISELNKLAFSDVSNDGSSINKTDSPVGGKDKNSNCSSSSSDECILISNGEEDNQVPKTARNNSLSLTISKSKKTKKTKKNSSESDSKSPPDLVRVNVKSLGGQKGKDIYSSDDDDEPAGSEQKNISKGKDSTNTKTSKINWDTSSSESTERDWVMSSKRRSVIDTLLKEQQNYLKTKKLKNSKKGEISSSDEDLASLCNLKNFDKKRKRRLSLSSGSISSCNSKAPKAKQTSKIQKEKPESISLMDCVETSCDSGSSTDFNLDFDIDNLKIESYNKNKADAGGEPLGTISFDSDVCDVLTDSSLDSIVNLLEKKNKTVRRSRNQGNKKKSSKRRYRDKLLTQKLTDTDNTEGEENWRQAKMKQKIQSSDSEEEETKPPIKEEPVDSKEQKYDKTTKKKKRPIKSLFSDSEENLESSDEEKSDEEEDAEEDKDEGTSEDEKTKKKRKRIQRHSDSSEDEDDDQSPNKANGKGRRNIRKVLKEESLEKSTKEALQEEQERKRRITEKQKIYNDILKKVMTADVQVLDELVLDFDEETKEPIVSVDKDLVKKLKPHQAQGIKFMWDSCFESVKEARKSAGSGCILAHCMGLGKTLQVITLVHTILTNEQVDVNRILVVAPFSTVQNWVNEFCKWLKDVGSGEDIEVYHMLKTAPNHRSYQLREWERTGGVMVLGYNLFRTLVSPKKRVKASVRKAIEEVLLDPGPDIVVCDEGHILKNEKTAVNSAMSKLKTRRRIVLTGTPLQNNLIEYHCMVQFVKPNLLGTRKEFQNRFVHPIQNGQFEDSTAHDVKIMKRRAHVLHKMLDGIVQRKDYTVLTPYLPPKYEYVIHVKLTEVQINLYRHYLDNFARKSKNEGGGLFQDFQHLMRICTHPRSLMIHSDKEILKKEYEEESEGSLKEFINDGSDSDTPSESSASSNSSSSSTTKSPPPKRRNTRANKGEISEEDEESVTPKRTEWWANMVTEEQLTDIKSSSKLFLFFTILKHCEEIGDKLLVFSQSLYTLDLIEHFLDLVDENARKNEEDQNPVLSEFRSNWDKGLDYFRLDGGTTSDNRANWCKIFNSPKNTRARLFLISTRAGGLGINLTGANRVIIFDASWNPSFDVQSIFRVYRFGQTKPCYIYRFLSKGTMEEKIYERQVAKLSTSLRVIDEHQIDRHFTQNSLAELYCFNPEEPENRETPILPKDRLMAELLQNFSDTILKHHQHDSLLENLEDEELNEEERKTAWQEFENEKNNVPPPNPFMNQGAGFLNPMTFNIQAQMIVENLIRKIKDQNPSLNEDMVKKRAIEALQAMPFWQNHQTQYIQQQQNLLYQQEYIRRQQLMYAQQQLQQQGQIPNPFAALAAKAGEALNGRPGSAGGMASLTAAAKPTTSKNAGVASQPIEIQDDD